MRQIRVPSSSFSRESLSPAPNSPEERLKSASDSADFWAELAFGFSDAAVSSTRDAANIVKMRGHLGWENGTMVANVMAMCASLRAKVRLSVWHHLRVWESDYTGFPAKVQRRIVPPESNTNTSGKVHGPIWLRGTCIGPKCSVAAKRKAALHRSIARWRKS